MPVLSAKLARDGDDAARRFFARVRGASLVALALVTVAGVLLARPLTDLFAGGYHQRPGEFERTVDLTRLVFPYIFFMGTAALGMAALNANRRFAVAAFAPALLNVALIAAAFAAPYLATGDPVQALAVGALVGGGLQVVAQWPALRRIGYAGRPAFVLDPDVREVLRRIAPLTFGIGIYYIDLVLSRRFLSELGTGAQSYFSWAMRLCDFPQGIFVMALSTAALPSLSALAARGAREELAKTWAHGMGLAMFVAIPASVALVALGEPIVVALFQRGEFDAAAAHETARALLWQGGASWTVAAVRQTVPALYALGDTRTPVIVSALDLLRLHRARGRAAGADGTRGHQRGGRGIERGADGPSARGPVLPAGHDRRTDARPIDRADARCIAPGGGGGVGRGRGPVAGEGVTGHDADGAGGGGRRGVLAGVRPRRMGTPCAGARRARATLSAPPIALRNQGAARAYDTPCAPPRGRPPPQRRSASRCSSRSARLARAPETRRRRPRARRAPPAPRRRRPSQRRVLAVRLRRSCPHACAPPAARKRPATPSRRSAGQGMQPPMRSSSTRRAHAPTSTSVSALSPRFGTSPARRLSIASWRRRTNPSRHCATPRSPRSPSATTSSRAPPSRPLLRRESPPLASPPSAPWRARASPGRWRSSRTRWRRSPRHSRRCSRPPSATPAIPPPLARSRASRSPRWTTSAAQRSSRPRRSAAPR